MSKQINACHENKADLPKLSIFVSGTAFVKLHARSAYTINSVLTWPTCIQIVGVLRSSFQQVSCTQEGFSDDWADISRNLTKSRKFDLSDKWAVEYVILGRN